MFVTLASFGGAFGSAGTAVSETPTPDAVPETVGQASEMVESTGAQNDYLSGVEAPRQLEASLELRRLAAGGRPETIPRPKGLPGLIGGTGLLGHAGYQAFKTWGTFAVPSPWISLGIGKARFDTTNLGIFSLFAGLALVYLGLRRRLHSHKVRERWRLEELLRQDRQRIQQLRDAVQRRGGK